jgi:dipicolinate synthase subunit A
LQDAAAVVLPVPVTADGVRVNTPEEDLREGCTPAAEGEVRRLRLSRLLELVADRPIPIFGGRFPPAFRIAAEEKGLLTVDYLQNEEVQVRNAIPTAEGALAIAMRELPVTLFGARTAVVGYGRVGRALCQRLLALGARVTVAARDPVDRIWAEAAGAETVPLAEDDGTPLPPLALRRGYEVIFNTVPVWLFDEAVLQEMDPRTLLVDLASAPGGVDIRAAKNRGVKVIWALSLPGRCAPRSAGRILGDCIGGLLRKEGIAP